MEPACHPADGPMRPDHDWNPETRTCRACGVKRKGFVPTAEEAEEILHPLHDRPHVRKAQEEFRSAGKPIDIVIVELEAERDRITAAIETLRRLRGAGASTT